CAIGTMETTLYYFGMDYW
nr:immunoglobulin heavy chain junction region [Mus musculus]